MAALLLTLLFWFVVFMIGWAEQGVLVVHTMEKHDVGLGFERRRAASRPVVRGRTVAKDDPTTAQGRSTSDGWETAYRILHAVNTPLPKTGETIDLLQRWLIRLADLPPEPASPQQRAMQAAQREIEETLAARSPFWILGTSLGFEFVVLACAAWVFCRRDF